MDVPLYTFYKIVQFILNVKFIFVWDHVPKVLKWLTGSKITLLRTILLLTGLYLFLKSTCVNFCVDIVLVICIRHPLILKDMPIWFQWRVWQTSPAIMWPKSVGLLDAIMLQFSISSAFAGNPLLQSTYACAASFNQSGAYDLISRHVVAVMHSGQ